MAIPTDEQRPGLRHGGLVEYLGTWHGALLLRQNNAWFQQSDDGALAPKWREFRITKKVAQEIMSLERVEGDFVFGPNDANIPPVVDSPFWNTNPVEYLIWHRDHDPSPWSERAAAALAALQDDDKAPHE